MSYLHMLLRTSLEETSLIPFAARYLNKKIFLKLITVLYLKHPFPFKTPYHVNLLLGGFNERTGPELYWMDHLASMVKVPFATHGYGGLFSMGVLDRYYREDLTREEAYEVMKKCVAEVQKRLIINLPNFQVKILDKDGIHSMDVIRSKDLMSAA